MGNMPPKITGASDIFQTPKWPIDAILEYIPKKWTVLEPACGRGHMVRHMERQGYDVIASDIDTGVDFLNPDTLFVQYDTRPFDCIVTNPPYSIKDEWLTRCYEIGKPFALLLPITAIEGKTRHDLYRRFGVDILLLPTRVNYMTPSGSGSGAWFFSSWFTWGLDLPSPLTFSDVVPPVTARTGYKCDGTDEMFSQSSEKNKL